MNGKRRSVESICASAGTDVESATRPLMAPIYQGSVFEVESLELLDDIYAGSQDGFIYSRDGNPNVENLERVVAELENADDAVAFASGMGAIGITLLSMVEAGDTVLAGDVLYGGTNLLLRQHLPRLGVRVEFVDVTDLGLVERALDRSPKVILVESITNPLLRLTDVEGIARLAGERDVQVVVDNTLATPLLMRPLELGADVTIHSATKLLGGHSDVMGGVAAGRFEAMASIRQSNRVWGSTLDPFAAWLIVRGIRTLPLRVARTCENAMRVSEYLSGHAAVSAVHYPGLDSHPQHELARSTLEGGFGSMVSFELRGGVEAASKFIRSLKMIRFAASLGETCTTVSHPAKTSHRSLTEGEREEVGIYGGLIRMSCGIESAEDIEADLGQALEGL